MGGNFPTQWGLGVMRRRPMTYDEWAVICARGRALAEDMSRERMLLTAPPHRTGTRRGKVVDNMMEEGRLNCGENYLQKVPARA